MDDRQNMADHKLTIEKAQVAAAASPGEAEVTGDRPLYRRRPCLICLGVTVTIVVILVIILIILFFTLLKAKDPRIKVNSLLLENFQAALSLPTFQPAITLVLSLNVTINNPNRSSFKYNNSTSYLFYHGETVGEAPIPAGQISALGKQTLVTLLHIQADRFLLNPNLLPDVTLGILPISSQTILSGRVKLLKLIKRHATSTTVCDIVVSITNRTISNLQCNYKVKL
ncbi:hypothetical protein O6H91_04G104000 [Diphasiastrum complanatum]|uniref:Uncharacterized protein n=1 Tax=Diphasiastrum complanatum TaxID=34168 RepID=A0ACC2E076_DIPCM|nr:hypothetical protein O6H91_Y441300 [Diphasiastrum complanatum]KAJ7559864.1 hypothetical protein O6H91_04G104000 [Diphasiastrum complanatum]